MSVINIKNIKKEDCACPKLGEKVTKPNPCITDDINYANNYQNSGEQMFKVKNLFGELKSDWQKAEARKNLKVNEIVRFTQTKIGQNPGDENVWEMVTSTGGEQKIYRFVVKNGESGKLPKIEIGTVTFSDATPSVNLTQNDDKITLNFVLPKAQQGNDGASVSKVTLYYKLTSSNTTAPTSGWSTSFQEPTSSNPYLWAYLSFTTTNNKELKSSAFLLRTYQSANPGGSFELLSEITDSTTQAVQSKAIKNALEEKADIDKFGKINGVNIYDGGDFEISSTGTIDSSLLENSPNPVQNKVITEAIHDLQEQIERNQGGNITVDTSLNEDSSHPVTNSAITRALAKCIKPSQLVTINGKQLLYDPQSPTNDILIGDGFEASIKVCGENDTADANLCFFQQRPLQGVALYNDLLQNGSVTGTDGKVYTYSPSVLYHLYDDGSFITIEDDREQGHWVDDYKGYARYKYLDQNGNIKSQVTSLPYYGRVIPGVRMLYATAGDTAYGQLRVGGPFYADVTEVTIEYDQSKINIYEVVSVNTKVLDKIVGGNGREDVSFRNKPENRTVYYPNKKRIKSGDTYKFGYNENRTQQIRRYNDNVMLIYERVWNNPEELKTPISVNVNFKTKDETKTVTVLFGETQILYKSGNFYTSLSSNNQKTFLTITKGTDLNSTTSQEVTNFVNQYVNNHITLGDPVNLSFVQFGGGSPQYIKLEENIEIDQTKYNLIYAKIHNMPIGGAGGTLYLVGRLKNWTTVHKQPLNGYYSSLSYDMATAIGQLPLYGEYPLLCSMQDYNYSGHKVAKVSNDGYQNTDPANTDIITLNDVSCYVRDGAKVLLISEIGIIKHKAPFEYDSE